MKTVDDYERIRKAYYVEGLSIREINRQMHHGRRLIRKAIDHAQPEGYMLKGLRTAPVLAPYKPKIDKLIIESEQMPRKQRYTGHKIYQLVQAEGYQGSEGNVHHYVSQQRQARKHSRANPGNGHAPGYQRSSAKQRGSSCSTRRGGSRWI